jgi:putative ABC transport system substrate-binding protein
MRRRTFIAGLGGAAAWPLVARAQQTAVPVVGVLSSGSPELSEPFLSALRLNQPGANLTGVTFFSNALLPKRLALLRDLIPKAAVFAVLINPNNVRAQIDTSDIEKAAQTIGQQIQVLNAGTAGDIDRAFAAMAGRHADALLVNSDAFFFAQRDQLVGLAARHAVPANYGQRQFVEVGGLFSYGSDAIEAHRQAGVYAGRILKGEKPADLPVQQPTKFDLVINLKTAKVLGLTVPQTLLAQADEVIE